MDNLKKKISEVYYNHGLFCATHPVQVLVSVCIIVIILCFPLCQLFIMEDVPLEHMVLREDEFQAFENSHMLFSSGNRNKTIGYGVQIVLHAVPSSNAPTGCFYAHRSLLETLKNSAKIVRLLHEFQSTGLRAKSFGNLCLQIEDRLASTYGESDTVLNTLPTFGCLLLAPSLLWNNDPDQLDEVHNTLLTKLKKPSMSSLRDLYFGLPWRLTGIRDTVVCAPQTMAFVVTTVLREYDPQFVSELRQHLASRFHTTNNDVVSDQVPTTVEDSVSEKTTVKKDGSHTKHANHVYMVWYRGRSYVSDYAPLILIYIVLLLYVYFSVCKLAMVKSKWGLAFSACFTVVASLCMSMGLCIAIGLMVPTLSGREIFPYLVVLIGFENVVILTKSVVATPIDLPVKYRIAEGLSKESWPLTKHFFTQLVLLCLGFFTFHPTMQEFCLFAVVGLTTDFFLQLFFFVTVLSVDIRRMELSDLTALSPSLSVIHDSKDLLSVTEGHPSYDSRLTDIPYRTYRRSHCDYTGVNHGFLLPFFRSIWLCLASLSTRLKRFFLFFVAHTKPSSANSSFHPTHKRRVSAAEAAAFLASDAKASQNVPRRLRILRVWANHRLFQRLFMILVALWIILTVMYTAYLNPLFTWHADQNQSTSTQVESSGKSDMAAVANEYVASSLGSGNRFSVVDDSTLSSSLKLSIKSSVFRKLDGSGHLHDVRRINPFFQPTEATWDAMVLWNFLAFYQWPLLAKHYNMSLAGHHLVILEPIHLEYEIPISAYMADMQPESSSLFSRHLPYGVREPETSQLKLDWAWMFSSNCNKEETPVHLVSPSNGKGGSLFREYADDLLSIFGKGNPRPVSAVSPGGVAGWTARLWLTATILGTSFVGCSCVLLVTCLGMIFFQELQTQYSTPSNREPVIRVLPLSISLDEPSENLTSDADDDELCPPDWIVSCGKVCHLNSHGVTQIDGIVAVCGINQNETISPSTTSIRLWSTTSGSPLPSLQRYSEVVMNKRQSIPVQAKRLIRRRSTVWCMVFIPCGSLFVGCSDGSAELWDCLCNQLRSILLLSSDSVPPELNSVDKKNDAHPVTFGGITTVLVTGEQSVCLGTSRGHVAWFDEVHTRHSTDQTVEVQWATRQWHQHTRTVTQLAFMNWPRPHHNQDKHIDGSSATHQFILSSSSEDGSLVFMDSLSGNCLHTISLDPTAVLSFDFSNLLVATSHASGSLFVSAFRLLIHSVEPPECPEGFLRMEPLDSPIQLATAAKGSQPAFSSSSHSAPYSHIGSVGLKLYPSPEALQIGDGSHLVPSPSAFRLVTCELDGTLAIWSIKPACIVRTFRLNLSSLFPANPLVSLAGRVVFGDQGYLRVVNPWTTKYERSVQLLPPSAVSMRNSSALSILLRRWSKELVPVGIAGSSYDNCTAPHHHQHSTQSSAESPPINSLSGSAMINLANCGRTLVVIPLSTLQTVA